MIHKSISLTTATSQAATVGVLTSLVNAETNCTQLTHTRPQFFAIMEDDVPVLDDVAGAPELASRYAVVAILTGETRKPMAGEWYIKGPVYGAWRACSQMIRSYPIAKLVTVVAVAELRVVDDGVKLAKVSA